jgi:hypothetical protein
VSDDHPTTQQLMASHLDSDIVVMGEKMKVRDLAEGQFRLMVFSAIQHPDEDFRQVCVEILRDGVMTAEALGHPPVRQRNEHPRD